MDKKYKEIGSIYPFKMAKYRARKFSDEALRKHVLINPSAAFEEIALFFSVKRQSVFARMKSLGTTREKRDKEKK